MAGLLLLSGNWFSGLCHAGLLAYLVQLYSSRRIFVDTTDAFRQLPQQKMQRGILLGSHLALFVLVVYRSVSTGPLYTSTHLESAQSTAAAALHC